MDLLIATNRENNMQEALIDKHSSGLAVIDTVHEKIHAGGHFTVSHGAAGVANNGNLDIRFKTGADPCHVAVEIAPSGKAQFNIYEAATIEGGTALVAYNNNRMSAKASGVTVTHTPTVTDAGTVNIIKKFLGSGTAGVPVGLTESTRQEFIFKPDTEYLLRLTNTSGGAADLNTIIMFYE